jgi:soluble lytic murein transglycosylase-like protein
MTWLDWLIVAAIFVAYLIFAGWCLKRGDLKDWGRPKGTVTGTEESIPYDGIIWEASTETGVPPWILVRLLLSESDLDPSATGKPNADGSMDKGIAQLNDRYMTYYADKYSKGSLDPYDPRQAIPVAARYLSDLYMLFGCWACAVEAYKHGPTRVLRAKESGAKMTYYAAIAGGHTCGN